MTNNAAPDLAVALAEKRREATELKLRCRQQENQLATMSRSLRLAREESKKLRFALSQAISKFDEFKEHHEEVQKFVAKSKERINSILDSCEDDDSSG